MRLIGAKKAAHKHHKRKTKTHSLKLRIAKALTSKVDATINSDSIIKSATAVIL